MAKRPFKPKPALMGMVPRTIFHVDMDAFFVSVEELFDPGLKGKAVVVGGLPGQRGVVSAASYEARKFGVHSAMPLVRASKLCPQAIFLPGRRDRYVEFSKKIQMILEHISPVVEMVSIDEAFLDFTGSQRLYGHPVSLAEHLLGQIKQETGLSASIGISTTKLVSKVASDLAKPNGILHVFPGSEADFLAPLSVEKLPGIGKVTQQRLRELGILRVRQLTAIGCDSLLELFGHAGESLYQRSLGNDTPHFTSHPEPKSISHEHTFDQDTTDAEEIQRTLAILVQKSAHRLREQKLFCRTVTLKLRDREFKTMTRALSLAEPTQLDEEILQAAIRLFRKSWHPDVEIRLIGIALSGLDFAAGQTALFTQIRRDRMLQLYQVADKIRGRFGYNAITSARTAE